MSAVEETFKHIRQVALLLNEAITELQYRAIIHDKSKLESPEVEIFDEYTAKLKGTTYGSEEYKRYLKEMKPALDHHYANNQHHPEHYEEGIDEMTLIDLVEMLCDWKAATMRHNDGDIIGSLEINKKRYDISDQLLGILENTVRHFGWDANV